MAREARGARGYLSDSAEGVLLSLRVSPGAKKPEIKGVYGERALKLAVAAPPKKGRANAEAERFLAEAVGVAASEVEVVRGASGRDKVARSVSGERVSEALEAIHSG